MWFVVHVKPGSEEQAAALLRQAPKSGALEEVFCPVSLGERGKDGGVEECSRPLLDGCVFVVAPSKWELRACLRRADGLEGLYDGQPSFEALEDGEWDFIDLLAAPGDRMVPMSEGVMEGDRICVQSGPLHGREQDIRKYSSRCRWAYLDTRLAGAPATAQVGLRVTSGAGGRCG